MAGQYGADNFLVYTRGGNPVAAKWLTNANGQYVIDPLTQQPYIVPFDYNPANTIDQFSTLDSSIPNQESIDAYVSGRFVRGGSGDLQRNYDGFTWDGNGNNVVPLFADAASYNLGLAAQAAGIPESFTIAMGGLYNYWSSITNNSIDTSGPWWNNANPATGQNNAKSISIGYNDGLSGRENRGQCEVMSWKRNNTGPRFPANRPLISPAPDLFMTD